VSVQAYPLHWPQGFPRCKAREYGRFKTSYDSALANVQRSLRMFAADSGKKIEHAIMSSNMNLLDKHPADPGVAVWFMWDGMQVCIPVDRYNSAAANLQAIHHIIEARRVELRHGTLSLVRATFQGFKALPAPPGSHWRDVLSLPAQHFPRVDAPMIETAFRNSAKRIHPDRGGSDEAMARLNAAREAALSEVG